jgi:hypothetical protein
MGAKRRTPTLHSFGVFVGPHVCRRTEEINGGIGITESGTTEGILAVIWRLLG